MKAFWTILMTFLLAVLPAGRSFGSESDKQDCGAPCAKCCCCVQTQNSSAPAQNVPLSAPTRAVSAERAAPVLDKTVALPPLFAPPSNLARENVSVVLLATEPLFERYCSLLI